MKRISIFFIICLGLLSACANEEETVNIDDKDFANTLYVQKVENNFTSKELTKPIEDQEMIQRVLTMVDGLQAEKMTTDEFIQQLENHDSYYRFGFYGESGVEEQRNQYAFQIMTDGTIIFNFDQINNPSYPLISVETHQNILKELKKVLEIHF
ncbi:hypothetical protein JCM21714_2221 [Gracilibacillus boraciitolerans JCM 21714]|uniref:Lipoprotein n=1 Tax=Gracilibacillus boraciitolerans JCM 21714 TaxID=1298598 RepID=W4VK75_9BACI|nr:hypothetical protein [Gracilibacillus boraciitolerans]GAE93169.1 hypothetical protein JCM21714_2221 [Gracilibacillus boraciitolerans JCM 21714]